MSQTAAISAKFQQKDFADWIIKYYFKHYRIGFLIYFLINLSYIEFDYLLAPNLLSYSLLIRLYIGSPILMLAFLLTFSGFYQKNFIYVNAIVSSVIPFSLMVFFIYLDKNNIDGADIYFSGVCLQVTLIGLFVYKWRITVLTSFLVFISFLILVTFTGNENVSHFIFSSAFLLTVCITTTILSYHYQVIKTKMFLAEIKISEESQQIEKNNEIIAKQKFELEKINKQKDKLFSIIAHDLRSPFNGLINLSEIYLDDFETLTKHELFTFLKATNESSNRLYDLLNELLLWAKSMSGKMVLNIKDYSLYEIIHENISLVSILLETKEISIKSNVMADMLIKCDKIMLGTILRNLISNAIKFTHKKGEINIGCKRDSDNYIISVADNGIGISEDILENLFKIDQKTSNIGTEGEKGTGLGLILCKEFVERQNGKIWVESKLGNGSTFFFTMPVTEN